LHPHCGFESWKKVFDGTIAEATRKQNWVRLRVGNFDSAVEQLRSARLINGERDRKLISLGAGVAADQVVRLLVERGIPVFEIAPQEETLEDFYLALMKPRAN
jgi:hypothetical protein